MIADNLLTNIAGKHLHFVGIKGTGMTALVEICNARNAIITGSDVDDVFYTDEILKKYNIVTLPFQKEN
ncbi:MAG: Mur ligase domain-containing protein, partial [Treponemataceae bacterium]